MILTRILPSLTMLDNIFDVHTDKTGKWLKFTFHFLYLITAEYNTDYISIHRKYTCTKMEEKKQLLCSYFMYYLYTHFF